MWRGAGARSHAPGAATSDDPDEPDDSYEPNNSDESFEADETHKSDEHFDRDELCDANAYDYDEPGGAGQYTVTASCMKWSTRGGVRPSAIKRLSSPLIAVEYGLGCKPNRGIKP